MKFHSNNIVFILQYRCKGSHLLRGPYGQYGYWASQDNTRRNYWGGSTTNNYCACGMTSYYKI